MSPKKRKQPRAGRLQLQSAGHIKDNSDDRTRQDFFRSVRKYQKWPGKRSRSR